MQYESILCLIFIHHGESSVHVPRFPSMHYVSYRRILRLEVARGESRVHVSQVSSVQHELYVHFFLTSGSYRDFCMIHKYFALLIRATLLGICTSPDYDSCGTTLKLQLHFCDSYRMRAWLAFTIGGESTRLH